MNTENKGKINVIQGGLNPQVIQAMQGLFCGYLSRLMYNGWLVRWFVKDMVGRGVLSDGKQGRSVEREINILLHGTAEFFMFQTLLENKENEVRGYGELKQELINAEHDKRAVWEIEAEEAEEREDRQERKRKSRRARRWRRSIEIARERLGCLPKGITKRQDREE